MHTNAFDEANIYSSRNTLTESCQEDERREGGRLNERSRVVSPPSGWKSATGYITRSSLNAISRKYNFPEKMIDELWRYNMPPPSARRGARSQLWWLQAPRYYNGTHPHACIYFTSAATCKREAKSKYRYVHEWCFPPPSRRVVSFHLEVVRSRGSDNAHSSVRVSEKS